MVWRSFSTVFILKPTGLLHFNLKMCPATALGKLTRCTISACIPLVSTPTSSAPRRNYRTAAREHHKKHITKDHVIFNPSEPEYFLCCVRFFLPFFLFLTLIFLF